MGHDYSEYFARLLRRIAEAEKVQFLQVHGDGWEPKLNKCHENVDYWIARHTDCKSVRGWLFWPPNEIGQYTFRAHSVTEEGGGLIDITPIDKYTSRDGLLFLAHLGSEAEFEPMKTDCAEVVYPPLTQEEWQEYQRAATIVEEMDTEV